MKKYATYIKISLVLLLFVFIMFDVGSDKISDAEFDVVKAEVNKVSGFAEVPEAENRLIKRFYGLDPNEYEGIVLYAPQDDMAVEEMLLVKLKDISQQESVQAAIEKRLDTQLTSFEGYGAEQVAMLNKHVLSVEGNYIFYMVGENTQKAQKVFLDSL
ncbi:MAG: DUF4358 domain-containing protein [Schaedlerella sp.]|nr:DUF4358 domain-containing protein [Schaedlerella sp.]